MYYEGVRIQIVFLKFIFIELHSDFLLRPEPTPEQTSLWNITDVHQRALLNKEAAGMMRYCRATLELSITLISLTKFKYIFYVEFMTRSIFTNIIYSNDNIKNCLL